MCRQFNPQFDDRHDQETEYKTKTRQRGGRSDLGVKSSDGVEAEVTAADARLCIRGGDGPRACPYSDATLCCNLRAFEVITRYDG